MHGNGKTIVHYQHHIFRIASRNQNNYCISNHHDRFSSTIFKSH